MLPVLVMLLIGVLAYGWWRSRYTTLTSACRWRQDRAAGDWVCAACGARTTTPDNRTPRHCLRNS